MLKLMALACFLITLCCESLACDVLVVYVIDVLLFEHHNTKALPCSLVEVAFAWQTKHALCRLQAIVHPTVVKLHHN